MDTSEEVTLPSQDDVAALPKRRRLRRESARSKEKIGKGAVANPSKNAKKRESSSRPTLMIGALAVAVAAGGGLLYYRHVEAQRAVASIPSHLPALPTTNPTGSGTASSGLSPVATPTPSVSGASSTSTNSTPTTLSAQQVLQSKNPFTPLVSTSSGTGK